jgi:dTDP-4-amino-4,6-dideoxygalactose transaminase
VQALHAERVLARRYFYPGCHAQEPYRSLYPNAKLMLPATQQLTQAVMALPTGTAMSPETINRLSALIRFMVGNGHAVTERLHAEAATAARP